MTETLNRRCKAPQPSVKPGNAAMNQGCAGANVSQFGVIVTLFGMNIHFGTVSGFRCFLSEKTVSGNDPEQQSEVPNADNIRICEK